MWEEGDSTSQWGHPEHNWEECMVFFSVYSWFMSDAEELEGSKISVGHSGQPSCRRDTRVMSRSCASTACDHLE